MSKRNEKSTDQKNKKTSSPLQKKKHVHGVTEYQLTNGLRILFAPRTGTGIVTSNIMYFVGSRDEAVGETGLAHMFEHMLFKPTVADKKRKIDSGIMDLERQTGVTINANTWKDRTTYYICYPKEHFNRALEIEVERMRGLVLTDAEFKPEQKNVLSEFDMYAGDEHFALSVQMAGVAFQSHPYGHETIGYREDIEAYTIQKLKAFYDTYYVPNNAVLIITGDVKESEMKRIVLKHFAKLKPSLKLPPRSVVIEPKQEGLRVITIERSSEINVHALGMKHNGFPTKGWFETMIIFEMLAGGDDSILYTKLVDTGLVSRIETTLEPTYGENLAILFLTFTKKTTHEKIHMKTLEIIKALTPKIIAPYLAKTLAKSITHEFTGRENSLGFTAELVEYASAGAWQTFFETERILGSITSDDIMKRLHTLFDERTMTIGNFKGIK